MYLRTKILLSLALLQSLEAAPSRSAITPTLNDKHNTTDDPPHARSSDLVTSSGTYSGHLSSRRPDVLEFLGITYAQAPTGRLRFAAPKAFLSNQFFNASAQPDDCPYVARNWGSVPGENLLSASRIMAQESADGYNAMSEDCLKLNIWTPISSSGGSKPVLVFLYGGGELKI